MASVTSNVQSGTKVDGSQTINIYCFSSNILFIFDDKLDMTSFSDNFTINTQKDTVYGRNDPIVSYSGTQRSISFALTFNETVKGKSTQIPGNHLAMLRAIASSQYPRYETLENSIDTNVLKSPPLVAIYIPNLIAGGFDPGTDGRYIISSQEGLKEGGQPANFNGVMLPGYIDSFNITYDVKDGLVAATTANIQREYSVSITFTPLHDRPGGFKSDGKSRTSGWPW